jgi:hypothetical protein
VTFYRLFVRNGADALQTHFTPENKRITNNGKGKTNKLHTPKICKLKSHNFPFTKKKSTKAEKMICNFLL